MWWYLIILVCADEFIIKQINETVGYSNPILAGQYIIGIYVLSIIVAAFFIYKLHFGSKPNREEDDE
jgi:hypothetical protein